MLSEFVERLNQQIDEKRMERLSMVSLEKKLEEEGYIYFERKLSPVFVVKGKGQEKGLFVAHISRNGKEYDVLMVDEQAQKWLLRKVLEEKL